ncbi:restriction endonuclease subunit S [Deinococcus sp.]|uniref:restriction endonuclease subunit S n=1 Tax=Deinococcus sp. TaxID=47478 RepID=UPI003919CDCC
MKSEYQTTTLGELIQQNGGSIKTGPFGTTLKASEYSKSGVPVISVGEVGFGEIRLHQRTPYVDRDVTERLPEYVLESGDIVFGRKGAVERSAWVKDDQDGWFLGSDGIRLRLPNTTNSRFISYSLLTERHRSWMLTNCVGTTMHSLNQGVIERIPIVLPPLPIQNRIADILSAFDEKIELNRQMNRTLEQMARALFKSWFIDFDPVHAKQRGEQPAGMDAETAALFPNRFEQIDGKEVPEGWRSAQLGDIAEIIDCLHSKKPERVENGFPYVQLNNIGNNGEMILSEIYLISEEDYKKWTSRIEIREGDCIITNVGRVGAVCRIPKGFTGAIGRNMTAIRLKESFGYFSAFCIQLLTSEKMRSEINDNTDSGTILNALNVKNIPKLKFIMADKKVVEASNIILSLMRDRIEHNLKEIDRLSQVRDSLLPRLLSGELDVSDWENAVEAPENAPA